MTQHSCSSRDAILICSGIFMVLSFSYGNNLSSAQIAARRACVCMIREG
jgi:hypothetical protein